ncbi:hypothetical protein LTR80_012215, partial [Exophiala xenobiotica]
MNDKDSLARAQAALDNIAATIQTSLYKNDPALKSLLDELTGDEPAGQILRALTWTSENPYWRKWGRHYLPSLLHAHQRQMCNTFKDPGPLLYGTNSPLFIKWRTELDSAFDNLPAPKPSRPPRVVYTYDSSGTLTGGRTIAHRIVNMRRYNLSSAPCFSGECRVIMGDGATKAPIKSLRPGTIVWTPMGARAVAAVLKTRIAKQSQKLCRVGELLVTPWHPIKHQGQWTFPNLVTKSLVPFNGSVYSLLLAPFHHPDGHAIMIEGEVC